MTTDTNDKGDNPTRRFKNLAIRQYRHNNGEGLVFGYDKELTDIQLDADAKLIQELKNGLIESMKGSHEIELRLFDEIESLRAKVADLERAIRVMKVFKTSYHKVLGNKAREIESLRAKVGLLEADIRARQGCVLCNWVEREMCVEEKEQLRAKVAELEAEIAGLKEELQESRIYAVNCKLGNVDASDSELAQRIEALEAEIAGLRKHNSRMIINIMEMHHDNIKGDFNLSKLARIDLDACVSAAKALEVESEI